MDIFETALDRMHETIEGVIGTKARLRPVAGAAVDCVVEKRQRAAIVGLDEAQAVAPEPVLIAQRKWFAASPRKGDVFELLETDGVTVKEYFRVLASPTVDDDDARLYTIEVEAI